VATQPERIELTPPAEETVASRELVQPQRVTVVPDPRQTVGEKLLPTVIYVLLILFGLGNISSLALFWLNGLGLTTLSDVALASLAAATIAEVAGLLMVTVKVLAATLPRY